jgi:Ca2+-binding EF-hand superfamily protein
MTQQLPLIPNKSKGYRGNTVAERVSWMTRTSDVYGSYDKTDLESYLTLIRRKVQEKCTTCVDLMNMIRRLKVSNAKVVTPIEFRFTLIKFGITLDQALVDRIFNVFDSDRSGTMDFDEFATWIMNSEFKPKVSKAPALQDPEAPEQQLRRKFLSCVRENVKAFEILNKQVSFIEFISLINRKNMKLTEKEARTVFQILDFHDSGYVSSNALIRWAETGKADYVDKIERPPEIQVHFFFHRILQMISDMLQ